MKDQNDLLTLELDGLGKTNPPRSMQRVLTRAQISARYRERKRFGDSGERRVQVNVMIKTEYKNYMTQVAEKEGMALYAVYEEAITAFIEKRLRVRGIDV